MITVQQGKSYLGYYPAGWMVVVAVTAVSDDGSRFMADAAWLDVIEGDGATTDLASLTPEEGLEVMGVRPMGRTLFTVDAGAFFIEAKHDLRPFIDAGRVGQRTGGKRR